MRRVFVALVVVVASSSAQAEDGIVKACERAAQLYFQQDDLQAGNVQSFPELDPPRVRIVLDGVDRLVGETSCEFDSAEKPYGLTKFCGGISGCDLPASRLEELQVLMQREGY